MAALGFGDTASIMVADKLIEVQLLDGRAHWILIHIEIQSQRDATLPLRVFDYNYRISRQYGQPVASLVTQPFCVGRAGPLAHTTGPAPHMERYWRAVQQLEKERKMELLNPLEQWFIDQGMKRGLEQGLERGRSEGAAQLLEWQLTQRFGPLPQATQRKLAKAGMEQLCAWSDALQDAQSLKQIFK